MLKTIYKDHLFEKKVFLISGGGTGIGLRTAKELALLGATVILASRTKSTIEHAANQIRESGGQAHAFVCNIREEESISYCIDQCLERAGQLDGLINNAGGQFPALAEQMNRKGWDAVIETNLTGTFFMSQIAFQKVLKKSGGAIVNIIANMWNGFPGMAHTGAARAGVENLTKTLANEWGKFGVRVNAIAPGIIASSGLDTYGPEVKESIEEASQFNQTFRLGTEAEVSGAILFLLSPVASFITGETLKVDAGESIYHPLYPPEENDRNSIYQDE